MSTMLRLRWWLAFHRPRYLVGATVFNRYSGGAAVLAKYLGPYLGWHADSWEITEQWRTAAGDIVAVGYFWEEPPR